ncbi:MAG: hypothetical protein GOV02_01260 [Candidatus Aenigmarchaeota archaeon]|nr:hypothetical protein [Candidatus Aenigmarchaeota archaeon]
MGFEEHAEQLSIKGAMITLMLSSMGFVVALIWRDAIQRTIDVFFPAQEGLIYAYGIAFAVTVAAVFTAFALIKIKNVNIIPDELEPHKRLRNKLAKKKK